MEMHQVRYFVALAKHLNFTRAADALKVTQPSLTRAIQKLETELGGPLFRRERLNTHLTELGRLMLHYLQSIFVSAETANEQAGRLRKGLGATLRIGVCAGLEPELPTSLIIDCSLGNSSLALKVETGTTDVIQRRLVSGEFDAAFLSSPDASHDCLDLTEIHRDSFVVAFAESHRFATLQRVDIAALNDEPLVARLGCRCEEQVADAMAALGVNRVVRHVSDDVRWVAEFVRTGLGCAVLPRALAKAFALPHRALDDLSLEPSIMLATVVGRRHPPALAKLIETVSARRVVPSSSGADRGRGTLVRSPSSYEWSRGFETRFEGPRATVDSSRRR